MRISIDRRIAERVILRMRHTCMRGRDAYEGWEVLFHNYMKGGGRNECWGDG